MSLQLSAILIGDELLEGRVEDRNAATLGRTVASLDARLREARMVADDVSDIAAALDAVVETADLVVVSGGLGPTGDDVTREAAARWLDVPLELDSEVADELKRTFEEHGFDFTDNNLRQCRFPRGARQLLSDIGTAPGFAVDADGTECFFFPGVPDEFEWYVEEYLVDRVESRVGTSDRHERTMTFVGIGESDLETRIGDTVERAANAGAAFDFLPDAPRVHVRVTGPEAPVVAAREAVLVEIGDWLVTEGGRSIGERAGALLRERDATVATAESCTAGGLAHRLTETPGSSDWFEYGFVTYANRAKVDLLGVSPETLDRHGAVSAPVVRQMAIGACRRADADFALSISGIAGPSGGTADKPVGTVDFGLATPEGVYRRRYEFSARSREYVRRASIDTALSLLIWHVDEKLDRHGIDGPTPVDEVRSDH